MIDELLNVDIKSCSDSELKALINRTLPVVDLNSLATRELLRRDENSGEQAVQEEVHEPRIVAIANGRKLSGKQTSDLNEEDFDVIMDVRTNTLRFRKDPAKHSKLEDSKLEKIGPHRMQILVCMLNRPGNPFHAGNIDNDLVYGSDETARNTFSKSIGVIRKALGQDGTTGPYIVKRFDWDGITNCKRGCVYEVNPQWRYLLIRHEKISGKVPV